MKNAYLDVLQQVTAFFLFLFFSLPPQLKALFNRKLTLFYSSFIIEIGLVK